MYYVPWFVNHPVATLSAAVFLVIVIPRFVKVRTAHAASRIHYASVVQCARTGHHAVLRMQRHAHTWLAALSAPQHDAVHQQDPARTCASWHVGVACSLWLQALWKALVLPLFIGAGLFAAFQAPQQVLGTLSSLLGNGLSFAAGHPQLTSLLIIAATAVLLSSSVVPIIAAGMVWLLIFAPQQLSRFLPQVPNIPTWVVPGPVKSVRSCPACAP